MTNPILALILTLTASGPQAGDPRASAAAKDSASPLIRTLGEARQAFWHKVDSGRCEEAQAIEPELRREFPDRPFFLLWPYEERMADFLCGDWPGLLWWRASSPPAAKRRCGSGPECAIPRRGTSCSSPSLPS